MAQQYHIGSHKTTIQTREGVTYVRFWHTDVVAFSDKEIILNSGGWQTPTTKTRMNQTANQFGLGFCVYQRRFAWYVKVGEKVLPFEDNMKIPRINEV
jgi:hypothetical protein